MSVPVWARVCACLAVSEMVLAWHSAAPIAIQDPQSPPARHMATASLCTPRNHCPALHVAWPCRCMAVVEVIMMERGLDGVVKGRYSLGWALLPLFQVCRP